jgi:outer membrane protein, heavy metal efflux system
MIVGLCVYFSLIAATAGATAASISVIIPTPLATHIAQAVAASPRVLAARTAVDALRARHRAASQPLYNPEVGLDLEHGENDTAALGLSQTVDWGDKRTARAEVAGFKLQAAKADLASVRQAVSATLLNRFASYRTARSVEQIAGRRVNLMKRFTTLAEQRRRAGDLGQVELNLARLALAQARLIQSQAAVQRMAAEQVIIGITKADFATWPAPPFGRMSMPDDDFAVQRYLINLPTLRAHQAQIAAARTVIEVRARQTRPDPTLRVRGGR